MPEFRVTVRHGQARYQYHIEDVEAADLKQALALAAERLPAEVVATADLAEVRRQARPEAREYTPG